MMNATTQVGTTANLLGTDTVKAAVFGALACWDPDFDKEAITEDLRAEIAAVAPAGLVLAGDLIIADARVNTDNLDSKIDYWREAIDEIDFWRIVFRH